MQRWHVAGLGRVAPDVAFLLDGCASGAYVIPAAALLGVCAGMRDDSDRYADTAGIPAPRLGAHGRSRYGRPAPDRPSKRLVREGKPVDDGNEATGARRLREAAARLRPERRPARPARPLLGAGGRLELLLHAGTEAVLALRKGKRGVALRLALPRRQPERPRSRARARAAGRVNYLIGSDPARWHTNLPTYGEIVYRDLWPGIDLRLRGQSGTAQVRVPRRARARASAHPARLPRREAALARPAAETSASRPRSALLRDARPVSYQQIGGRRVAGREPVRARARRRLRLRASARYDRRYPLVIDPGLALLDLPGRKRRRRRLGHRGRRRRQRLRDRASPTSTDFPTTAGAFDTTYNGGGRRLRDEARRERRRPRLLHLPGRKRRRRRQRHRASTAPATPT